jgi:hypothetical protein
MKRVTPIVAVPTLLAFLMLTGCGGTDPSDSSDPRPTGSSTTAPVATIDETDETEGTDEDAAAEPAPAAIDDCGLTDADYAAIRGALEAVDPAVIGGYLANTVYVTYAATEYEGEVTGNPALVLQNLDDVMYAGVTWQFDIPVPQMNAWAASPYYGEDFTECAIVGTQSDDRGVSLTVADGLIVRELITVSVDAWGY